MAGKIGWDKQTQATNLGMAAIYDSVYSTPDYRLPYTAKAKVDDRGQMGLSGGSSTGCDGALWFPLPHRPPPALSI